MGFKYAKNALAARAPPRTPLGELTMLPQISVSWGGGHQSQCLTPLGAFSASILVPPHLLEA